MSDLNDNQNIPVLNPNVTTFILEEEKNFPNNQRLPVILYKGVIPGDRNDAAELFESLIRRNRWSGVWRNGIFPYHHYHSKAHEILAVYSGTAAVQLGGDHGRKVDLETGDVIVLPAGTTHKRLSSSGDFRVIGAYPEGQESYDMNYGKEGERPETDRNIEQVPLPQADPLFGEEGPLMKEWSM